jgi:peptidyl-prolyl cis-trans isomerase SurA
MRTMPIVWGFSLALALAGCDSLGKTKADSPVAGPPPPRMNSSTARHVGQATLGPAAEPEDESAGFVRLASAEGGSADDVLFGLRPVAVVNGSPILAADILERYGTSLEEARKKMTAGQFREARLALIERDLPGHIDRKLLAAALKSTLKAEQIKALNEAVGKAFDEKAAHMMKEMGVGTQHELDLELQKQKTSLASFRDSFMIETIAMEYLRSKASSTPEIGRPELLQYYEAHADSYAIPAKVKWQQILIMFSGEDEKQEALERLEQVVQELKSGKDFGDIARRYSDGYNAAEGGHFGWTQAGSLVDQRVEQALFGLPAGTVSQVFEDGSSFQLVKVTDRQEAGKIPFDDVQEKIRETLEKQSRQQLAEQVLEDLRKTAVITTIFDGKNSAQKTAERS